MGSDGYKTPVLPQLRRLPNAPSALAKKAFSVDKQSTEQPRTTHPQRFRAMKMFRNGSRSVVWAAGPQKDRHRRNLVGILHLILQLRHGRRSSKCSSSSFPTFTARWDRGRETPAGIRRLLGI
jgi:hypothetical protein